MALVMMFPAMPDVFAWFGIVAFLLAIACVPQSIIRDRRVVALVLVILGLASIGVVLSANSGDLILISPCRDLSPSDLAWWVYQCWQF